MPPPASPDPPAASLGWAAAGNRLLAGCCYIFGLLIACFGLYFAFFTWLNSGRAAGLELITFTVGLGLAFGTTGYTFRVIARAHEASSQDRWLLQFLLPLAAWLAFGLVLALTSAATGLFR